MVELIGLLAITNIVLYFGMSYYKKKAYYWYNEQERLICGFLNNEYDKEEMKEMMDCMF